MAPLVAETHAVEDLFVGVACHRLFPVCRKPVACSTEPVNHDGTQDLLPVAGPLGRIPAPQEGRVSARSEPGKGTLCYALASKSVEGVADRDHVERARYFRLLGNADLPSNVREPQGFAPRLAEGDGSWLLVERHDLVEGGAQGEGDLPRAAGQVEEPSGTPQTSPGPQVIDQRLRIRQPKDVVVTSRPSVQVRSKEGVLTHLTIMTRNPKRVEALGCRASAVSRAPDGARTSVQGVGSLVGELQKWLTRPVLDRDVLNPLEVLHHDDVADWSIECVESEMAARRVVSLEHAAQGELGSVMKRLSRRHLAGIEHGEQGWRAGSHQAVDAVLIVASYATPDDEPLYAVFDGIERVVAEAEAVEGILFLIRFCPNLVVLQVLHGQLDMGRYKGFCVFIDRGGVADDRRLWILKLVEIRIDPGRGGVRPRHVPVVSLRRPPVLGIPLIPAASHAAPYRPEALSSTLWDHFPTDRRPWGSPAPCPPPPPLVDHAKQGTNGSGPPRRVQ